MENLPENNAAFTAAVAFAIDGMSSSHVQITGVISGSIAKKTQENELYIDHCLVSYTITFHLRETKYSTATEAFASMSSNLVRTVASGEFNTLLHAYSVPTKASNLIATTSTTVTISSTYTVDETATVDDDETDVNANNNEGDPPPAGLSDAGIALVVLMCVIIVGTTAWLIISRTNWLKSGDFNTSLFSVVNRKEKKKRRYNVILGDSSHGNVINAIHESHDEDDGDMEFTEIDDKVGSHRPHANADNYRDNAGDDEEVEISLSNDSPFRSRGGYNSLTKDLDEERV